MGAWLDASMDENHARVSSFVAHPCPSWHACSPTHRPYMSHNLTAQAKSDH